MSDTRRELDVAVSVWDEEAETLAPKIASVDRTDEDEVTLDIADMPGIYMSRNAAQEIARQINRAAQGKWTV